MSDIVERARRLLADATPGPWAVAEWNRTNVLPEPWALDKLSPDERGPFAIQACATEADAALIAAAPTLLAGLVVEVERLRVELLRWGRLGNELASSIDHPTARQQAAIEAWEER